MIIAGCHPENRRDAAPDNPGRSKHNSDISEGSRYTIPAHKDADTGDYPAGIRVRDSVQRSQHDTTRHLSFQPK